MILRKNSGSVIITAIGMGIVLMFVIMAVHTFSSNRMQTTIQTSRKIKALALAEAGVSAVVSEMTNTYGFSTHVVKKNFEWGAALPNKQTLKNDSRHSFSIAKKTSGTYCGMLGDGEFKVRLGRIQYKDNPKTLNINEKYRYFKVESIGRYKETYRKVKAIIDRRFPGREFLKSDGGFLSLIYGEPGKSNKNIFSTGHLYGHEGVEIGQILLKRHIPCYPGTTQELNDMDEIISGAGGVFFYSPTVATLRAKDGVPARTVTIPQNQTFPSHGTYADPSREKYGEYPKELQGTTPPIPHDLKPWISDKHAGISIPPQPIPFNDYKKLAQTGGIYISSTGADTQYPVTAGWTSDGTNKVKSKVLDFGNNIHDSKVSLPANFNGVIYCEENLVIKGNPGVDIKIVSPKNIFVAGDFNQSGNPSKPEEFYGLNQDYPPGKNALTSADYDVSVKNKLIDDKTETGANRNHVAATVIAKKRIVYDYRSPIDCFENELYPFMKYELAKAISNETEAKNNCLKINHSGVINASATSEADFRQCVSNFIASFPIEDSTMENEIIDKLANEYNSKSGKFNFSDFDKMSKEVWSKYVEGYEAHKCETEGINSGKYGIYKLLINLRAELGVPNNGTATNFKPSDITDQPGDYLCFPEMTTNGMFISGGKLNNEYYAGPDYIKRYNEIGCSLLCIAPGVGIKHSSMLQMVHRLYGSEVNLRLYDVNRITKGSYSPPTRRRIYDTSLPTMGLENSKIEITGHVIISWHDESSNANEYNSF